MIIRKLIFLFSLVLLLGEPMVYAAGESFQEITVIAQRNMPSGNEQVAVQFKKDIVELTLNSNFMEPPRSEVKLGLFKSIRTFQLRSWELSLAQLVKRLDRAQAFQQNYEKKYLMKQKDSEAPSHLNVKYFLNGYLMDPKNMLYKNLQPFFDGVWRLTKWKAQDAVGVRHGGHQIDSVQLTYLGDSSRRRDKVSQVKCARPAKMVLHCEIPDFGSARFQLSP